MMNFDVMKNFFSSYERDVLKWHDRLLKIWWYSMSEVLNSGLLSSYWEKLVTNAFVWLYLQHKLMPDIERQDSFHMGQYSIYEVVFYPLKHRHNFHLKNLVGWYTSILPTNESLVQDCTSEYGYHWEVRSCDQHLSIKKWKKLCLILLKNVFMDTASLRSYFKMYTYKTMTHLYKLNLDKWTGSSYMLICQVFKFRNTVYNKHTSNEYCKNTYSHLRK